jgi:citrate lyase beta subunit
MSIRPRRTVLYMPGSNARALEKAKTLAADGVILDLEDAVAPDAKVTARDQVVTAVKAGGFGAREVFIRTNGLDTPWFTDDLTAAMAAAPDAILIPKISTAEQLEWIAQRMLSTHADHRTRIWAMIETPTAIFNVRQIAAAAKDEETRLTGFVLGLNDLAKETRARQVPYTRLQRRMRAGARFRLRRQDADPSEPDRAVQRRVLAIAGRSHPGAQNDRGLRHAGEQRQGRGADRRPHGRAHACRDGAAHGRDRGGDRGAR